MGWRQRGRLLISILPQVHCILQRANFSSMSSVRASPTRKIAVLPLILQGEGKEVEENVLVTAGQGDGVGGGAQKNADPQSSQVTRRTPYDTLPEFLLTS